MDSSWVFMEMCLHTKPLPGSQLRLGYVTLFGVFLLLFLNSDQISYGSNLLCGKEKKNSSSVLHIKIMLFAYVLLKLLSLVPEDHKI